MTAEEAHIVYRTIQEKLYEFRQNHNMVGEYVILPRWIKSQMQEYREKMFGDVPMMDVSEYYGLTAIWVDSIETLDEIAIY